MRGSGGLIFGFFKVFLTFVPVFVFLSGCQPRNSRWEPGRPFKTQIIVSKSYETQFQVVELMGVKNQATLEGEIVDFLISPNDEKGTIVGNKPLAKFIEDDGVFVPADQISLQMVTLYYHLQQLRNLELKALQSATSLLSWPRKVALAVRVINAPQMRYDNAFYNPLTDSLYFVPYQNSALPIPLNPGVIGHEHFHSLFSSAVLNPLIREKKISQMTAEWDLDSETAQSVLYKQYVLKIINEGLADVWGWIYSNDPDFVALSIPRAEKSRNLNKGVDYNSPRVKNYEELQRDTQVILNHCSRKESLCVSDLSYLQGTLLARSFKSFATARMKEMNLTDSEVRNSMAAKVLVVIQNIKLILSGDQILDLDKVIQLLAGQFGTLSQAECDALNESTSKTGVVACEK